jgi:hypothetical protein
MTIPLQLFSFSGSGLEHRQRIGISAMKKYQPKADSFVGRYIVGLSGFVLQVAGNEEAGWRCI